MGVLEKALGLVRYILNSVEVSKVSKMDFDLDIQPGGRSEK